MIRSYWVPCWRYNRVACGLDSTGYCSRYHGTWDIYISVLLPCYTQNKGAWRRSPLPSHPFLPQHGELGVDISQFWIPNCSSSFDCCCLYQDVCGFRGMPSPSCFSTNLYETSSTKCRFDCFRDGNSIREFVVNFVLLDFDFVDCHNFRVAQIRFHRLT